MSGKTLASIIFMLLLPATSGAQVPATGKTETAILAGGCFWCIEADFEKLAGVVDAVSGYIGGHIENPTYKQVSSGRSGHVEAVKITFDPTVVSFDAILDHFWRNIDPTRNDGQFCDGGAQYRPVIYYLDDTQKERAVASMQRVEQAKTFPQPIKVELTAATKFYPAEDYHQDYYKKNSLRYNFYRYSCGRDARLEELWGSKGN